MAIKGLTPTDEKAKVKLQCARAIPRNAQAGEDASLGVHMNIKLITAAVALSALASTNTVEKADAQTIYLGLQENGYGSVIAQQGAGVDASGVLQRSVNFGSFHVVAAQSTGDAQTEGFVSQITARVTQASTSAKTLNVYVSETGISGLSGDIEFISQLQTIKVPANWTIVESIYVNSDNLKFGLEELIAKETFTSVSSPDAILARLNLIPPYSITEVFSITAPASSIGLASAQATVTDPAIPEASTWAMMLAGFVGLGFVGHRRNKAAALVA
jgi:hypothetical protein